MTHLTEFDGKPLASVAKGALDLGKLRTKPRKTEREQEPSELAPFIETDPEDAWAIASRTCARPAG